MKKALRGLTSLHICTLIPHSVLFQPHETEVILVPVYPILTVLHPTHFRSFIHHVYSVWHVHLSFINIVNISSPDFKHVLPERGCLSSQIFTVFAREHVSMSFHLTQLCATWGHRPCMLRFNTVYIIPSPLYSKYFWNKISVEDYVLFLFIK